jgi:membrane protease YdiL (CAAX protease family)
LLASFWTLVAAGLALHTLVGPDRNLPPAAGIAVNAGLFVLATMAGVGVALVIGRGGLLRLGLSTMHLRRAAAYAPAWALFTLPWTYVTLLLLTLVRGWLGLSTDESHPLLEELTSATARQQYAIIAAVVASAVVVAPLTEELLFRGLLQTALSAGLRPLGVRVSRWAAVILTSAAFAVMHPAWSMPVIFVLSLFLGWLYEKTGNLWMVIFVHALFNAVSTAAALASATGGGG